MKYHVNAKGEAAECNATVRSCPLGGEHYVTLDEAQFAAELSQLLGEKIDPKLAADQEELLDSKVEVKKVLRLLEGTAQTHQFIRALATNGAVQELAARDPRAQVDPNLMDYHHVEMLKLVTERYFAENKQQLLAMPPADVFSKEELSKAGSMEEIYSLTRGTLDESVAQLNRVRLLAGGEALSRADSDFLRRQGELTPQLALARIGEITTQFDSGMESRMAFLEVTNPIK